jgi:hypothetical protein
MVTEKFCSSGVQASASPQDSLVATNFVEPNFFATNFHIRVAQPDPGCAQPGGAEGEGGIGREVTPPTWLTVADFLSFARLQ